MGRARVPAVLSPPGHGIQGPTSRQILRVKASGAQCPEEGQPEFRGQPGTNLPTFHFGFSQRLLP